MALSECPECAHHLAPSPKWTVGMVFECPECGTLLMVQELDPLRLEIAKEG